MPHSANDADGLKRAVLETWAGAVRVAERNDQPTRLETIHPSRLAWWNQLPRIDTQRCREGMAENLGIRFSEAVRINRGGFPMCGNVQTDEGS